MKGLESLPEFNIILKSDNGFKKLLKKFGLGKASATEINALMVATASCIGTKDNKPFFNLELFLDVLFNIAINDSNYIYLSEFKEKIAHMTESEVSSMVNELAEYYFNNKERINRELNARES